MIDDIVSIERLILFALLEANKLGYGTSKNPIDNIDILKYLELFKDKYLQEIGQLCHIDIELVCFLKTPLTFSLSSKKNRDFKNDLYLNRPLFKTIFDSIKEEYTLYLKDKYKVKTQNIYVLGGKHYGNT